MSVIQLSADPDTRSMLEALLKVALGSEHIVWLDGQREPDEGILQRMFSRLARKRGRRSSTPQVPPSEAKPSDVSLAFWHNGARLQLDDRTADLVRLALAERVALMLVSASEPALAILQLVHYDVDWEQVISEGVEVIKAGEPEGNRIRLETLEAK